MSKCKEKKCKNKARAMDYCDLHYRRFKRNGHTKLQSEISCDKKHWSDINIGWLAGIIEGEGYIDISTKSNRIRVRMTDKDIIEKIYNIAGCGYINGPYFRKNKRHKPSWEWTVSKAQQVKEIMDIIYPLMGERRKRAIDNAITKM